MGKQSSMRADGGGGRVDGVAWTPEGWQDVRQTVSSRFTESLNKAFWIHLEGRWEALDRRLPQVREAGDRQSPARS